MTERLWVFSFLSQPPSSANRSSPFEWKNDQQGVATLFIEGWTHTQTHKKKGEIKYLPRLVCVIVCIRELGCLDQTKKKCAYCETCCGDRYAPTQKKKKSVGIAKRKKRKWSISQSQIPWKKKKKLKKFLHSTATLFLLLSSFRVYWKISVSKDPQKGCHSIAHNRNSRERERERRREREECHTFNNNTISPV